MDDRQYMRASDADRQEPRRRTLRRDGTAEQAARRARSEMSDQGAIKGCLADEPP